MRIQELFECKLNEAILKMPKVKDMVVNKPVTVANNITITKRKSGRDISYDVNVGREKPVRKADLTRVKQYLLGNERADHIEPATRYGIKDPAKKKAQRLKDIEMDHARRDALRDKRNKAK